MLFGSMCVAAGTRARLLAALLGLASACDDERTCDDDRGVVQSCGLDYTNDDICGSESGRCIAACDARASCVELRADEPPPWLRQCVVRCDEQRRCDDGERLIESWWTCDGERDCVDGTDEQGCTYFECGEGGPVASDRVCDGFADCADGSDEPAESGAACP